MSLQRDLGVVRQPRPWNHSYSLMCSHQDSLFSRLVRQQNVTNLNLQALLAEFESDSAVLRLSNKSLKCRLLFISASFTAWRTNDVPNFESFPYDPVVSLPTRDPVNVHAYTVVPVGLNARVEVSNSTGTPSHTTNRTYRTTIRPKPFMLRCIRLEIPHQAHLMSQCWCPINCFLAICIEDI